MGQDLATPVKVVRQGNVTFNLEYYSLLAAAGLGTFEQIWNYRQGEVVKKIKARTVIKIGVPSSTGERIFYIKRHIPQPLSLPRRLLSAFWPGPPVSEGKREFDDLCAFREAGLATATPIAMGERINGSAIESFLLTEDFSPYVQLETILRDQPDTFTGEDNRTARRTLLARVAQLARRMHEHGANHRDFNATHVLLAGPAEPLALFDLQRVDRGRLTRFRWPVKCLAEMIYTLPARIFTEDDRRYLFKAYLGKETLHFIDRLHWRWLTGKTSRIARHDAKLRARRAAGYPR